MVVRSPHSVCDAAAIDHLQLLPGVPGDDRKEALEMTFVPPKAFTPTPLSQGWGELYTPPVPRSLEVEGGTPLLYPGEVHLLYGRGGSGKTFVALLACMQEARRGRRSVLIDYEGTQDVARYRLQRMGCTEEEAALIGYVKALEELDVAAAAQLSAWVRQEGIGLVMVDSLARAMAAANLEENQNGDVVAFFARMERLRTSGAALCFIDHVGHPRDGIGMPSPRGGSAKVDQVTAAYWVRVRKAWSESTEGTAEVFCRKGRFGAHAESELAAILQVKPTPLRLDIRLVAPAPPAFPNVDDQEVAEVIDGLLDDASACRSKSAMAKAAARQLLCSTADAESTLEQMIAAGFVAASSRGNGCATVLSRPEGNDQAA